MKMNRKEERLLEAEKELYDLIPRMKGSHGHYLMERSYESARNLSLLAQRISDAGRRIMDTFDVDPKTRERDRGLFE